MNELWKPIKGYEGRYEVSNFGNVRSLRYAKQDKVQMLKPKPAGKGYLSVCLYGNKGKARVYVHKLVADAFIPNPNSLNEINHINEIKSDNRVENLEWCTHKYNMNYGKRNAKASLKLSMRVVATLPNGDREYYLSQSDAEKFLGIGRGSISYCIHHSRGGKTAGGRKWQTWEEVRYAESEVM